MNFLKSNLWEIDRSHLLHKFGAIISLLHFFNYFYWRGPLLSTLRAPPLLCWDFFTNCKGFFLATLVNPGPLLTIYMLFSLASLFFFLWHRFVTISWTFLFLTFFLYTSFYISEASLRQDIHSLFLLLNIGFLFVPSKNSLIRVAVVSFYLVTAYKAATPDWLSGSSLSEYMPYSYKALEWVAATGIAIRFTLPLLLVSPFGQRLAIAVLGLLLYHGFIFYFQRDFSSMTMMFVVTFFIFDFFDKKKQELESRYQSYAMPEPSKLWWPIFIGCFLFAQSPFIPKTWPSELFRISDPAKFHDCKLVTFANFQNHLEHLQNIIPKELGSKLLCNPLIAFNSAKSLCKELKKKPDFTSLATYFVDRRLGEKDFNAVFSFENICDENAHYFQRELRK